MVETKDLKGKKITVIGAGVSGKALALLAADHCACVFVSELKGISDDTKTLFADKNIRWEEFGNTDLALDADEIVVSSGISPNAPILKKANEKGITIIGELDFVTPYLNGVVIGVTGSNGKTTTTSMIGYFLKEMGYSVMSGGNIGNAAALAADKHYDFIVLELSSFQLHWAKKFKCDIAIITNLAPDHIDWHGSYKNYIAAKANIINCLAPDGYLIYQKYDNDALNITRDDIVKYPLCWGEKNHEERGIYLDDKLKTAWINGVDCGKQYNLFFFDYVKLLGKHNLENTAMALGAVGLFNILNVPERIISSYIPPAHRCAFAGEIKNITFVDDSKGTNVAATITAMTSLPNNKVIILGGQGKGEDYAPLAAAVCENTHHAVILGSEKEKIANALTAYGITDFEFASDLEDAVNKAYKAANSGDTVLLSPACTSWDMYPSYKVRGEHFCSIVNELIKKEA